MKSKYDTHVLPYLDKITKWVTEGASAKEVAEKLGVGESTFRKYMSFGENGDGRYRALVEAFTRAQVIPDDNVEAALYKRACGYQYDEVTIEEKLDRDGNVHTLKKVIAKDIPPDPTSAMFWLTNRRPETWKYRPEEKKQAEADTHRTGVALIPDVDDSLLQEPEENSHTLKGD